MPHLAVDAVITFTAIRISSRQAPASVATNIQARRPSIGIVPIHRAVGIGIRQPSDIEIGVVNGLTAQSGN